MIEVAIKTKKVKNRVPTTTVKSSFLILIGQYGENESKI